MPEGADERELRELVARAAGGDRLAFRRLYRASVDDVHGQVGRLLGWGPETEDVVQDVFLEVFRALPTYRGEAAFRTWLFRVTHNVAISHLRRRRPHPVELAPLKALGEAIRAPDLDARRQVRALYVALDEVPSEAREAFLLFELEGLSLKAIAELTGAPLNTVASRVRRTRERLRRLLEPLQVPRRKAQ